MNIVLGYENMRISFNRHLNIKVVISLVCHKVHCQPCKYWCGSIEDEAMLGKEVAHAARKGIMEGACHGSEGAGQGFYSL